MSRRSNNNNNKDRRNSTLLRSSPGSSSSFVETASEDDSFYDNNSDVNHTSQHNNTARKKKRSRVTALENNSPPVNHILSENVRRAAATAFANALQTHRNLSEKPFVTAAVNQGKPSVTYTGYTNTNKQEKLFSATVTITATQQAAHSTNSPNQNLLYTCESTDLSLEEQYLLIAMKSAIAKLKASKQLNHIELMDLDLDNAIRSPRALETSDGQKNINLSEKEYFAITAYLKAYAEANNGNNVTVIYKGHQFLSAPQKSDAQMQAQHSAHHDNLNTSVVSTPRNEQQRSKPEDRATSPMPQQQAISSTAATIETQHSVSTTDHSSTTDPVNSATTGTQAGVTAVNAAETQTTPQAKKKENATTMPSHRAYVNADTNTIPVEMHAVAVNAVLPTAQNAETTTDKTITANRETQASPAIPNTASTSTSTMSFLTVSDRDVNAAPTTQDAATSPDPELSDEMPPELLQALMEIGRRLNELLKERAKFLKNMLQCDLSTQDLKVKLLHDIFSLRHDEHIALIQLLQILRRALNEANPGKTVDNPHNEAFDQMITALSVARNQAAIYERMIFPLLKAFVGNIRDWPENINDTRDKTSFALVKKSADTTTQQSHSTNHNEIVVFFINCLIAFLKMKSASQETKITLYKGQPLHMVSLESLTSKQKEQHPANNLFVSSGFFDPVPARIANKNMFEGLTIVPRKKREPTQNNGAAAQVVRSLPTNTTPAAEQAVRSDKAEPPVKKSRENTQLTAEEFIAVMRQEILNKILGSDLSDKEKIHELTQNIIALANTEKTKNITPPASIKPSGLAGQFWDCIDDVKRCWFDSSKEKKINQFLKLCPPLPTHYPNLCSAAFEDSIRGNFTGVPLHTPQSQLATM